MSTNNRTILLLIWEFTIHLIVATVLFFVLTLPVILIGTWVDYLKGTNSFGDFIPFLNALKYLIFAADVFLFVVIIIGSLFMAVRGIIELVRSGSR